MVVIQQYPLILAYTRRTLSASSPHRTALSLSIGDPSIWKQFSRLFQPFSFAFQNFHPVEFKPLRIIKREKKKSISSAHALSRFRVFTFSVHEPNLSEILSLFLHASLCQRISAEFLTNFPFSLSFQSFFIFQNRSKVLSHSRDFFFQVSSKKNLFKIFSSTYLISHVIIVLVFAHLDRKSALSICNSVRNLKQRLISESLFDFSFYLRKFGRQLVAFEDGVFRPLPSR